jgi:hypothetical protein
MAQGLSAFRKFIPADLVRSLLRQGVEAKPGGAVQELTVMFIDIAGFTGLSERMGDRVVPLLSEYWGRDHGVLGRADHPAGSRAAVLPGCACVPSGDREVRPCG